jgi:hypothetical protein
MRRKKLYTKCAPSLSFTENRRFYNCSERDPECKKEVAEFHKEFDVIYPNGLRDLMMG